MRYRFPYVGLITVQPDTSPALQDHGYGPVYHAMCPFTPPTFAEYSFAYLQRDGSGRADLGAWFCGELV